MKRLNIDLSDLIPLILLILAAFAPFLPTELRLNTNVLIKLIYCYIFAYLGYIVSFMESKKVLLLALPLIIYTAFLVFFLRGFKIPSPDQLLRDLTYILTNLFDIMAVFFVFFIIEYILSRILGPNVTVGIAITGLILYLVMHNTTLIPFDLYYKDTLVYFSFYVMASRIKPATRVNPAVIIVAIAAVAAEIYIYYRYKFYPGLYFSVYLLSYIVLKATKNVTATNPTRYKTFTYLYPYWLILTLVQSLVKVEEPIITLLAVLITYVIGQLLYKLRVKALDYGLVGMH